MINIKKISNEELKFYIEKVENFYNSEKYKNMKTGSNSVVILF